MFGYVTPCKMELKVKDYEKFKAYYCGLCQNIKSNYGNFPRLLLNYDMTFLGILLSALDEEVKYKKVYCLRHPSRKMVVAYGSSALDYAAKANYELVLYKMKDDVQDDGGFIKKLLHLFYTQIKKNDVKIPFPESELNLYLKELDSLEVDSAYESLDEISEPFAKLTGVILSHYKSSNESNEILYNLGYNLGKWIYIIDALDDCYNDFKKGSKNPLIKLYGSDFLKNKELYDKIKIEIDFNLTLCANACLDAFKRLQIKGDKGLIENILQMGLLEKMDLVYTRSEERYE